MWIRLFCVCVTTPVNKRLECVCCVYCISCYWLPLCLSRLPFCVPRDRHIGSGTDCFRNRLQRLSLFLLCMLLLFCVRVCFSFYVMLLFSSPSRGTVVSIFVCCFLLLLLVLLFFFFQYVVLPIFSVLFTFPCVLWCLFRILFYLLCHHH